MKSGPSQLGTQNCDSLIRIYVKINEMWAWPAGQTLFQSQRSLATPLYWPTDEQLMTNITLGPYHPNEAAYVGR